MSLRHMSRRASRFGVVAVASIGLAAAAQSAAFAAPSFSVSPATGLSDGQSVSVSVSGAAAGETYYIAQCAPVGGQDACDPATATSFTTDASGAASFSFVVHKSYTGSTPGGTPVGSVDCATDACNLGAGNSGLDLGHVALTFG
ncbi:MULTISPECIES: enediyne antibiotic chromoprotein [unclassified Streptomyces]|uniref:enediyne antibiotic chromoprotein n=1 Tax=unclassified Streptomyces TaxID=2593676 RepID=UPI0009A0E607|nr:enediyne antibiotic chromoprotein [Streptomyces sp. NBRC 110465]